MLKLYGKNRVLLHAVVNNAIKIQRKITTINLMTIFPIIMNATQHNVMKKKSQVSELRIVLVSIASLQRLWFMKRNLSGLYKALFTPTEQANIQGCVCVIDGGYLLHRVM